MLASYRAAKADAVLQCPQEVLVTASHNFKASSTLHGLDPFIGLTLSRCGTRHSNRYGGFWCCLVSRNWYTAVTSFTYQMPRTLRPICQLASCPWRYWLANCCHCQGTCHGMTYLRIHHKRPPPGFAADYGVFNADSVRRKAINCPYPDLKA